MTCGLTASTTVPARRTTSLFDSSMITPGRSLASAARCSIAGSEMSRSSAGYLPSIRPAAIARVMLPPPMNPMKSLLMFTPIRSGSGVSRAEYGRADPDDSCTFHYRCTKVIAHPHRQRVHDDAFLRERFGQLASARERHPLFLKGFADRGQ